MAPTFPPKTLPYYGFYLFFCVCGSRVAFKYFRKVSRRSYKVFFSSNGVNKGFFTGKVNWRDFGFAMTIHGRLGCWICIYKSDLAPRRKSVENSTSAKIVNTACGRFRICPRVRVDTRRLSKWICRTVQAKRFNRKCVIRAYVFFQLVVLIRKP